MKKLVLFGHSLGREETIPEEMGEVSICTTPKNLRKLAAHFIEVALDMERMGADFDHAHFQPGPDRAEIVICRYDKDRYGDTEIIYDDDLGFQKRVPKGTDSLVHNNRERTLKVVP
jgi:hypothetical protein